MQTYNFFVDYYDEIVRWINSPLDEEVEYLGSLIEKYWNNWKEILELACWTGTVMKEFIKKWYKATWLDINQNMLNKAKSILWDDKNLILWDMTDFDLQKDFDVVLCNYNSICHLLTFENWKKTFLNAYNHLKTGWLFIFDINTIFEFENITRDFAQFYNFGKDTVCLEMFKKQDYYEWLVKIFKNIDWKNNYELIEEVVRENSFEIKDIKKELENIWFKILKIEDFHYWDVNAESERVYFICKK